MAPCICHVYCCSLFCTVAHCTRSEVQTILRENYVELHGAVCVNLADMARKLYAQGFITESTLRTVMSIQATATNSTKADSLIEEFQTFMLSHESPAKVFGVFLGILGKGGGALHNVAASILEVL